MRSKIVNREHLDNIAKRMDLAQVVIAHSNKKETLKKRICGDVFEALIGAMYLDKGYDKTCKYIVDHVINSYIDVEQLKQSETDFKSRLIEWGQKHKFQVEFNFEMTTDKQKNSPQFTVQITISDVPIAKGSGKSKKEAEQKASQKTLNFISSSSEDFSSEALMHYLERMKERKHL